MASTARSRRSREEDEDPDEEDEDEEVEDRVAPRRRARPRRPGERRRPPPRRWHPPDGSDEEDEVDLPPTWSGSGKRSRPPVFWRARDSLYFEPLVALAIVVVLLVGLYAYTGNWPPVYVVESDSMQHGSSDVLGLINTGDLVLAQRTTAPDIVPYVTGLTTGFSTYGEYGDVVLYHPNGAGTTPIIHRALLYLQWDPASSSYSAPDLNGLPCGTAKGAVYSYSGPLGSACSTSGLTGTLSLYHLGWKSVNVSIDLSSPALGQHSGYVTMGDNNFECSTAKHCIGFPDQTGGSTAEISSLVKPAWVIGVARGMIPWFGSLKLLLEGQTSMVPSQSWEFLGLTVAGVILAAFGVHWALRTEGIESPLRKEEEEEDERTAEADEEEEDEDEPRPRRWGLSVRPWRNEPEEDLEPDEAPPRRSRRVPTRRPLSGSAHRGRPKPRVRRSERTARHRRDDDL